MRRIISGILGLLIGFGFLVNRLTELGAGVQNGNPSLHQPNSLNIAFAAIFLLGGLWYLISGIVILLKKDKNTPIKADVVIERKEPTLGN